MESKFFAISVRKGPNIVLKTIKSFSLNQTLGDVLEYLGFGWDIATEVWSGEKQDSATVDLWKLELSTQLSELCKFGQSAIFFSLSVQSADTPEAPQKNAFTMMMNAHTEKRLPEKRGNDRFGQDKVFDRLIDVFSKEDLKFPNSCVNTTGKNIISSLSNVLYYLDPHHGKFLARGLKIPPRFAEFQGYNQWQSHKHKEPKVFMHAYID